MRQAGILIVFLMIFSTIAKAEETQLFPLGNNILKQQGIELPLPFGISALFSRVMVDTRITKFKLPLFGEIPGINFKESETQTDAYQLRADLWLLPFMDIYILGGYIDGDSKTTVEIRAPGTATPGLTFEVEQGYHGNTFGFGTTLVYAVTSDWIASLDINYTEADLNVVDSSIETLMITPRITYSLLQHGVPAFIGFGIPYMDTQQTLTAKIPTQRPGQVINAELNIKNKSDWNAVLSAGFEVDRHWQLISEIGFYQRDSFMVNVTYRF